MILYVAKAKYISDYKLWLGFNDGTASQVDLKDLYKKGGVISFFDNVKNSRNFFVQCDTVCWNDYVDVVPEFLQNLMFEQAGVVVSK